MNEQERVFLFLSPDINRFLTDNDIRPADLISRTGQPIVVDVAGDPATAAAGQKDPTTVLIASAAVLAAATPLLLALIRNLTGRDPVVRERRLVPVLDATGGIVRDSKNEPILHWVDEVKQVIKDDPAVPISVRAFGIEISFGAKE